MSLELKKQRLQWLMDPDLEEKERQIKEHLAKDSDDGTKEDESLA